MFGDIFSLLLGFIVDIILVSVNDGVFDLNCCIVVLGYYYGEI